MSSEYTEIVNNLRDKIHRVIALYEQERYEKNQLLEEKKDLTTKINSLNEEIIALEKKYETLKVAKAIQGSGDEKHDAKLKINKLVREIDNCIALLNK